MVAAFRAVDAVRIESIREMACWAVVGRIEVIIVFLVQVFLLQISGR